MPANTSAAIARSCEFSQYLHRLLTARPEERQRLEQSLHHPFSLEDMQAFADWPALDAPEALAPALRRLRQAVVARLICRDLEGLATLDEVVSTISQLAEFAVRQALACADASLPQYGRPIGEDSGEPQQLIVIGMGKLGGGELNVSSDIDLIFIYPEGGETDGARKISNHEYFTQVGKRLIALLNDATADGQVFRVDMRLRPYGDSGPLVMSFAALENYLLSQGREWERYAWIKAKAITGDADGLAQLVRPFVYRKYLDYNAYGAMRELHAQIRREVARRDMADNIKLGPGGIREAEFIAQVFQLIRGGRDRTLQLRGTRATLERLAALRLLEPAAVAELQASYAFLRNLEHRLQYLDDQQTQTLPEAPETRQKIAASMGHADWPAFLDALNEVRRKVSRHFEQVFILPSEDSASHPLSELWLDVAEQSPETRLAELGYADPAAVARQLTGLAQSQRYLQMPLAGRKQLDALMPALIEVAARFPNADDTLSRIIGLMEAISRRASYLALLTEYPQTLQRLASLYSSSAWVSAYLSRHPILLDELLDARVLYAAPDWPLLAAQLETQLAQADGDVEAKMDALRHFQHAQTFRLVAQDLAGMWTLEALSDELSRLADLVLAAAVRHAWRDIPSRHCETPRFAVIGYGKLGGKELGYASDLDIIFLYDDEHPDAPDLYSRLARKLSTWLTSATAAGVLYDIDLRLRPNGSSGLLVSSVSAFRQYQENQAWVWEHQALTRARFVAGDAGIGSQFEAERHAILTLERDPAKLRDEVMAMRQRMLDSHPAHDGDVKNARGGIIDIEFIVQYLILAHAKTLPALTGNTGNIALLAVAAEAGLIDRRLAEDARAAYRLYRRLQHSARLNDRKTVEVDESLRTAYARGRELWRQVFEQALDFS
ncbi:bifunctional [glutamate--ammonia ligase]-adenylyl-L-tyrosine phosphorylase/[glutamate--ammonia-ligase] adenylyltransferase [Chromobacterium violaceum]|uniref:bifunctional [glutamate--ammonia ligase]-adenylyl-L-tyrosine phosphorylase/[glutamate--ammonia-ligase] adenylyltransferase n=1 Tax=Chromobacterium violaceum TaxID=536 RepID=UPI0009D9DBC4|nr:bifunctional [glutamate--ammonia ligase]-adenylyl-L-tyrosine phosphorylase/[glutamate--ammonia-ligase] adenylyltransferase [Chromobacterium violaceum]OQS49576.1 bifunctional glutamine synthetase adenylyltransferase/deadenyltransferase [Chromobacterium violaceum]OQS51871.1 bifunctional glutamine synthetase adenylyltransferase/deadenyltransferase [Chromobacterium violaceum]QRO34289.1 bifunctional [glutamate--ammonia ligase]-adenylyl-L-tyrosine phosphorylase/[glutamate--ammonia-ligase] adenylylt